MSFSPSDTHRFLYPLPAHGDGDGRALETAGHTLLLPVVSVGSAPQLAVDLLLRSPLLSLQKIARLDHSDCIPFAAPPEHAGRGDITTPLEVFQNASLKLTVVQQRSPVFKSQESQFAKRLVTWIRSARFERVIILSSIDAAARTDQELSTPLLTLLPTAPRSATFQALSTSYPEFQIRPPPSHLPAPSPQAAGSIPIIPGGGMTRKILSTFQTLSTEKEQQGEQEVAALLLFCAEGDNRPDAHFFVHKLAHALGIEIEETLVEPTSWQGLFGAPLDQSMYG
ncbi:hypothetical protein ACQY0O_004691 [Thecaphora frezii]